MKKVIAWIASLIFGIGAISYGATILTTNTTDTIGTFRTNVNTSLTNLNEALTGFPATTTANKWNALQEFSSANCYGTCSFGGSATSSFSSAGALTLITPLLPASGGTGSTTLASNQVLLGNGTGNIGIVSGFGTVGQALVSNGANTAPSWSSIAIDTTQNYSWTGTSLFKNLNASSTVANPIVLNGVSLNTPTTQGAASTTLMNDGTGALSWHRPDMFLIASTTLTGAVATTTLTIPSAGTDLIIEINVPSLSGASDLYMQFNADTAGNYGSSISLYPNAFTNMAAKSVIALTNDNTNGVNGAWCEINVHNAIARAKGTLSRCAESNSSGAKADQLHMGIGLWNNTTSRITSVSLGAGLAAATLGVGTRISVYSSQY